MATGLQLKGIDVSKWQGSIDWKKVKNSGQVEFVIHRAGWGTSSIDPNFKANFNACQSLGIPCGVYWFLYCANDQEALQNANACVAACRGLNLVYPMFADFEYDSVSYANKRGVNVDKATASRWVKLFLDTCLAAGFKVGNYTNLDFINRYFNDSVNKNYDLWYAYWGSANAKTNAAPIWQYSSKGSIPGINGNVDVNICHKDYGAAPAPGPTPVPEPDDKTHTIPAVYSLVFDADWYFNRYSDLQDALNVQVKNGTVKNTKKEKDWWLFEHFLKYGMEEASYGRYGCASFNVVKYKAAYADLQKAFGNKSWKPYYYHYMEYGYKEIQEGRRPKVDLSV